MKEKDEEITQGELDEAMKHFLSIPASASEPPPKRRTPSTKELHQRFRLVESDDGFEMQEIEDE